MCGWNIVFSIDTFYSILHTSTLMFVFPKTFQMHHSNLHRIFLNKMKLEQKAKIPRKKLYIHKCIRCKILESIMKRQLTTSVAPMAPYNGIAWVILKLNISLQRIFGATLLPMQICTCTKVKERGRLMHGPNVTAFFVLLFFVQWLYVNGV